jgi:ribonuclease I
MAGMNFKSPLLAIFQHEWASHGTCYSTLKPS